MGEKIANLMITSPNWMLGKMVILRVNLYILNWIRKYLNDMKMKIVEIIVVIIMMLMIYNDKHGRYHKVLKFHIITWILNYNIHSVLLISLNGILSLV